MTVTFYINDRDNRALFKTLNSPVDVESKLKADGQNLDSPVLTLAMFENFAAYNYAYIREWGKYYFVVDVSVDLGGRITVQLRNDVLMTYRLYILKAEGLIYRQSKNINPLIADNLIQQQANEQIQNLAFSGGELKNQITADMNSFVLVSYPQNTLEGE